MSKKKLVKNLFLILGLGIFGYFVYQLGWESLLEAFSKIGWWSLAFILLAIIWQFCHTLAWHEVLKGMGHFIPFYKLFQLKLIAEAVNMLAPSGNLGGDTVRAYLIKSDVPLSDGIPSVVVDKTLDYYAKMIFNMVGFGLAMFFITIPTVWLWGCWIYMIIIVFLNALLIWVQIKGLSGATLRIAKLIPPLHRYLIQRQEKLADLDENLKTIYSKNRINLYIGEFWHIAGRMLGVVEVWGLMNLLGAPISFIECFFFMAVLNIVNGVFFLFPGQWGVSEGAQKEIIEKLGQTTQAGLELGILRRIRRLIITGIGLLYFAFYEKDKLPEEVNKTLEKKL